MLFRWSNDANVCDYGLCAGKSLGMFSSVKGEIKALKSCDVTSPSPARLA